jgi:hypothetical protein
MRSSTTSTTWCRRKTLRHGHPGSVGEHRQDGAVHFLLILIVLMLAFPFLARVVGGMLKGFFWLLLLVAAIAAVGALVHG